MRHTFVFQSADATQALFECLNCSRQVAFVLPGNGQPCAVQDGDAWAAPEDADRYVDPCETPAAAPVPEIITKRQFLIQLLRSGMVTADEVNTLAIQPPALMQAVLANMTNEQALEARLGWAAMTQVERHSPLVLAAAQANNISEETLDAFFIAAGVI